MLISLEINDSKSKVFLEFLKNLDFVTIKKSELENDAYINLLNERIEEYKANPSKTIELSNTLKRLQDKYGF